jgi:lipoprotein signal peptidase
MRKYFLITFAIFLIDRILKILSVNLPGKIFLLPGIVSFDRHINYGIIFSFNFPMLPVIIVSAVFMAVILILTIIAGMKNEPVVFFGWSLVLAGAVSNFADRVMYLGTVDYINILDRSLVNLADGMILAGIIVLLTKIKDKKELKKEQIIE